MDLFGAFLDDFGVLVDPFGLGDLLEDKFETFEEYLYFAGGQTLPRDVHLEAAEATVANAEGKVEPFDDILLEDYVLQNDFAGPDSDAQILGTEILDVLAEDLVQKPFHQGFKHTITIIMIGQT